MSTALYPGSSPRIGVVNVATSPCRYGAILVATTDRGICDIHLGTNPDGLVENYRRSATREVSRLQSGEQPGWLAAILNLVEDPTYTLDHPLDVQGTPFQKLVWQELCAVPIGQTTTYGELAEAIGKPRAYRAVGSACRANRLALAIPCHRVLRKGAGPLAFRWGANIKMQILATERSCSGLAQQDRTH